MFRKTKRHFSEGDFLFATFIEFVKCWGSSRRSRLFMEFTKSGALVNFSTFLEHPGMRRFQKSKMALDEETKTQDPKSNRDSKEKKSKKKSKKKTERNNQQAAIFQKRKKDEAELDKNFEFSEPLSENTSGLDDSAFMNLDGNVTLNQGTTGVEKKNLKKR